MKRAHPMPFGAELGPDGTRFSLWAPTARKISLLVDDEEYPLPDLGEGWRELTLPQTQAGARYAYKVDESPPVPDPASRFQPDDVAGRSLVIDPCAYTWEDPQWRGRPFEEAVLYELHVGTATPEGSYAALTQKLAELGDLGVTAIELMPLSDFPGLRNWGYDGVLPFAPDASYGTPDELKRLIDRAHGLGLMVFIDVVYNHFGPSGNHLSSYAGEFFTKRHITPWGDAINFDGQKSRPVREFFVHNALYWLEEFHADGLRLDAVHAIKDESATHVLAEIAEVVRQRFRDREIHLVLENDANEARWLERDAHGRPRFYTAQWNDDFHHVLHSLLTGETEGYYADYADDLVSRLGRTLAEGFAYQGEVSAHRGGKSRGEACAHLPPSAFVAFLQNHDQTGNRAFGERLSHIADPEKLALARALLALSPQTPLLFMGEEWAASSPFLFFVDFSNDPQLAAAVRDGRRREFARFRAFADPLAAEKIPDPTASSTASRSLLRWEERRARPHADVLADTKRLLCLRREHILPLTKTSFLGAKWQKRAISGLEVSWRYEAGTLRLLTNLDGSRIGLERPAGEEVVWASPSAELDEDCAVLPSWTGVMLKAGP
ncbi:MAG: malto-oligosyltrehalose trehalohydrolase [Hyphomicrobiales bacterium]|nr:malto-oligosyltrehalose trehalohydrolase [Hyphomicrobiales bacterium]